MDTCKIINDEETEASRKGWESFREGEAASNYNPYPRGSNLYFHFNIGWCWAEDRWLDE